MSFPSADSVIKQHIIEKLRRFSPTDCFIFCFYFDAISTNTLHHCPAKVGSIVHFKHLKQEARKTNPGSGILETLESTKHVTFCSKAKRMTSLAAQARKAGINPRQHMKTQPPKAKAPSASMVANKHLPTPSCPFTQAKFEWYNFSKRPKPGIIKLSAHRILLNNVISSQDVKYSWLSGTVLEVSIRYPDIMNFPVGLCELVTDDNGNQVFDEQHECVKGFEKNLAARREDDGYAYDTFHIEFDEEQNIKFVPLTQNLKGFDILRSTYQDSDGEMCQFKILQIVTKEKEIIEEVLEGDATMSDCGIVGSGSQSAQSNSNTPFASFQQKSNLPSSFPSKQYSQRKKRTTFASPPAQSNVHFAPTPPTASTPSTPSTPVFSFAAAAAIPNQAPSTTPLNSSSGYNANINGQAAAVLLQKQQAALFKQQQQATKALQDKIKQLEADAVANQNRQQQIWQATTCQQEQMLKARLAQYEAEAAAAKELARKAAAAAQATKTQHENELSRLRAETQEATKKVAMDAAASREVATKASAANTAQEQVLKMKLAAYEAEAEAAKKLANKAIYAAEASKQQHDAEMSQLRAETKAATEQVAAEANASRRAVASQEQTWEAKLAAFHADAEATKAMASEAVAAATAARNQRDAELSRFRAETQAAGRNELALLSDGGADMVMAREKEHRPIEKEDARPTKIARKQDGGDDVSIQLQMEKDLQRQAIELAAMQQNMTGLSEMSSGESQQIGVYGADGIHHSVPAYVSSENEEGKENEDDMSTIAQSVLGATSVTSSLGAMSLSQMFN